MRRGAKARSFQSIIFFQFESAVRNSDLAKDKSVAEVWSEVAKSLIADKRDHDQREVLFQPGKMTRILVGGGLDDKLAHLININYYKRSSLPILPNVCAAWARKWLSCTLSRPLSLSAGALRRVILKCH